MIWLWIDIRWSTSLCILGNIGIIYSFVSKLYVRSPLDLKTCNFMFFSLLIATMPTLRSEGTEYGNFILIATIRLWNQSIENLMSSWPLGCDFVQYIHWGLSSWNLLVGRVPCFLASPLSVRSIMSRIGLIASFLGKVSSKKRGKLMQLWKERTLSHWDLSDQEEAGNISNLNGYTVISLLAQ